MNMSEVLLTASDVQRILSISRTTLYRYINDGLLTRIKLGKGRNSSIRFSPAQIESLKEQGA